MSSRYFICPICERAFDTTCSVCCHDCGMNWCSEECALEAGAIVTDELDSDLYLCRACQGLEVDDYDLLRFLLEKVGMAREEAERECLALRNERNPPRP